MITKFTNVINYLRLRIEYQTKGVSFILVKILGWCINLTCISISNVYAFAILDIHDIDLEIIILGKGFSN